MQYCKALSNLFRDANEPEYHRTLYCVKNCTKIDCPTKQAITIIVPGIHETLDGQKVLVNTTIIAS